MLILSIYWYPEGESNPQTHYEHWPLEPTCLPIPPSERRKVTGILHSSHDSFVLWGFLHYYFVPPAGFEPVFRRLKVCVPSQLEESGI